MISAEVFAQAAREKGFGLWTGVPCSYLKPFINYVIDSKSLRYVAAANEGDAVAIAALGHYLACLGKRKESLENIKLAQQLAQKDMIVYYFSATALCALNKQDEALSAVHNALSLGFPPHMVDADAGLSSLKELPEYRAAITESIQEDMKTTDGDSTQ